LCSASHDYRYIELPLVVAPIVIGEDVWITADVFVAPGVTIADGVVVTARSSVFNDLPPWVIAGGYPAHPKKRRDFKVEKEV
jgi:putative colanic acid biosynthesis acetyltransferase WcaF